MILKDDKLNHTLKNSQLSCKYIYLCPHLQWIKQKNKHTSWHKILLALIATSNLYLKRNSKQLQHHFHRLFSYSLSNLTLMKLVRSLVFVYWSLAYKPHLARSLAPIFFLLCPPIDWKNSITCYFGCLKQIREDSCLFY